MTKSIDLDKNNLSNKCLLINSSRETKFRIICICHSGGYATQYAMWEKFLPKDIDCLIYERPGSGIRLSENLCSHWPVLMADAYNEIVPYLDIPYILFGHSLGGSIAFELAKMLQKNNLAMPTYLAIGDREAPSHMPDKIRYDLSDTEFKQMLVSEYNMDRDIANNNEIMEFFLPILRSDFKLADTYANMDKPIKGKIDCKIVVFRPEHTNDKMEAHLGWQNETNDEAKIINVSGDHFFVFNYANEFLHKLIDLFPK